MNSVGQEQPVHLRRLSRTFVVRQTGTGEICSELIKYAMNNKDRVLTAQIAWALFFHICSDYLNKGVVTPGNVPSDVSPVRIQVAKNAKFLQAENENPDQSFGHVRPTKIQISLRIRAV